MNKQQLPVKLRFWGVRGSLPAPGSDTVRYGGNTTCITIQVGDELIIFDAGSGLRNLSNWMQEAGIDKANMYFSHFHMDHICGLPFFYPGFNPTADFKLWAGHVDSKETFLRSIERLMSPPVFPVSTAVLQGCSFDVFRTGETLHPSPDVTLKTMALNHPDGCTGYRLEAGGVAICIITDYEHGQPEIDRQLVDFVRGADVMIYDAMFTEAEFARCRGYGHSTWQNGLAVAAEAGVRRPVIFHHDPRRTDDQLDELGVAVEAEYPGAVIAREGAEMIFGD